MVHRFGVFEFDDDSRELRKNGRAVALEPQPAKALALLLSRAGEVVTPRRAARCGLGPGHARRFRSRPCLLRVADPHRARRQRRQPALRSDHSEAGIQVHRAPRLPALAQVPSRRAPGPIRPGCLLGRGGRGPRDWRWPGIGPRCRTRRPANRDRASRSSTTKPETPNTIARSPACRISSSSD